jgi:hypothetical protein
MRRPFFTRVHRLSWFHRHAFGRLPGRFAFLDRRKRLYWLRQREGLRRCRFTRSGGFEKNASVDRRRRDQLHLDTSDQRSGVRRAGWRGRHSRFDMAEFLRYHFDDARHLDGKQLGNRFARLRGCS